MLKKKLLPRSLFRIIYPALTIVLFDMVIGPVAAQAPKLRFKHITNEQGLSNSTIESISQDSRGFLWFGTRDGLNRYDGQEIKSFRNDPADSNSLSDSYIRCIYEDHNQQLWIGTINGLKRLDRNKNRFVRIKNKPANK